jgi:hypothetical protein
MKYEWKGDYGDIPPRDDALELELFRNAWHMSQGDNMARYKYNITLESHKEINIRPVLTVCALCGESYFPTHRID